jgi:cytochrome P450
MHRDPRYFSPFPERFIPERWISNDSKSSNSLSVGLSEHDGVEFVTNHAAFIPYSLGPMNCVGKPLAQMELRVVVATMVQDLDMELDMSWDAARWERDMQDHFIFTKGKLPVRVSRRGAA